MNTKKFVATVCLLVQGDTVLLATKKHKIGAGLLNGYGGGVNNGEDIAVAAVRELAEETGKCLGGEYVSAQPSDLEKVAIANFHTTKIDGTSLVVIVHFFICKKWSGKIVETEEMGLPSSFKTEDLPFDKMMLADRYFFPLMLSGKKVIVFAKYGPEQKTLLEPVSVQTVNSFD